MFAWCYLATPSHSKKRGDTAPSLHSAMPTNISIIDLRETPALLAVCQCYQNCNGILKFSQYSGEKSPFAKHHGLLCAWYSHRCPLNMQLLGPHLSPNNPRSSFLNLPKPMSDWGGAQRLIWPQCFQGGWCRASHLPRTTLAPWCSAELS